MNSDAFEHLVNALALRVLGPGHTGFGPGSDGGRDGYFEGEALYPSDAERWTGRWYIQSKFHPPHLSKNPHKWLQERVSEVLAEFTKPDTQRVWPDIWILATNIDPSGKPETGSYDSILRLVKKARPELANRFHIWGGAKITALLNEHPEISAYYKHFLTPGHLVTALYEHMQEQRADATAILRHLIATQFDEQQYTKLEQAGSDADKRPGIHTLFIDLPFCAPDYELNGFITRSIAHAASCCHRIDQNQPNSDNWRRWRQHPDRARIWFIKGGPGNGKSTVGQYFCQIQRAALLLQADGPRALPAIKELASEVKKIALIQGLWPLVPRIPLYIELKEYAQWYSLQDKQKPRGVLSYVADVLTSRIEQPVLVGTLKRMLGSHACFAMFDGLDEVPEDVKDSIASEVRRFVDDFAFETECDLMSVCTSRPQGYSGQFSDFDGPTIELTPLSPAQALACAEPVIRVGRTQAEAQKSIQILRSAIEAESEAVRSLMTTPLQSHIMAVIVRDGGKPPDRRWHLFDTFYQVIKRRETNRDLPDKAIANLLREGHKLIKTVHNRLGFVLHSQAEKSIGAQTSLNRQEFGKLVSGAVHLMMDGDTESIIETLVRATTNRMVLVNTPDDGQHLRFDIRPLQEFFAAEFLYEGIDSIKLKRRLELVSSDSHWREVLHFTLSALIENGRVTEIDVAVQVLLSIDDSDQSTTQRMLRRRLAKGALLSARLLQEGVLEQDRRVRQQFRKCIEPLLAISNVKALEALKRVSQPLSMAWLLAFLMEHIREADRTESVGAAIVLCTILPDGDRHVSDVSQYLLAGPQDFAVAVLGKHPARHEAPPAFAQDWVREVALKLLLRDDWTQLCQSDVHALLTLIKKGREQLNIAAKLGMPRSHVALLAALLEEWAITPSPHGFSEYGIIAASYTARDWSTLENDFGLGDRKLGRDAENAPGILQFVYCIFHFIEKRSVKALRSLVALITTNTEAFLALPRSMKAYVPLTDAISHKAQIDRIDAATEDELQHWIDSLATQSPSVKRDKQIVALGRECNIVQWQKCVEDFPGMALTIWSGWIWAGSGNRPSILDSPAALDILVTKLIEMPGLLVSQLLVAVRLLRVHPSKENELRAAILSSAEDEPVESHWAYGDDSFSLDLPKEAPLLPHVLNAIVLEDRNPWGRSAQETSLARRRRLATGFVSEIEKLEAVIAMNSISVEVRAAALLISFLHQNGGAEKIKKEQQTLVDMCIPKSASWFFHGCTACLELLDEDEATAGTIMGGLLENARSNYAGRAVLERCLSVWRERSDAPLSNSGLQSEWLAGLS